MHRRKFLFLTFVFSSILICMVSSLTVSTGEEQRFTLGLHFHKPSYAATETLLITALINNGSPEAIHNASLNLEIKQREYPPLTVKKSSRPVFRIVYPQDELVPGTTRLEIAQDLNELGISEGIYPVSMTLTQRRKVLANVNSYLVVIDPRVSPPLLVALVWNVHEPSHFEAEGIYLDQKVTEECRQTLEDPGIHSVYQTTLKRHPLIQSNMNVSPVLLDQLEDMSNGYSMRQGNTVIQVDETATAASEARRVLRDYEDLIRSGQLELLPAPYAYPYLPDLTARGWSADVLMQVDEGRKVVQKALDLKTMSEGIYPPGLAISQATIPLLERTKVKYVILDENAVSLTTGTTFPLREPVVLQEDRSDILAFVVNREISDYLTGPGEDEAIAQQMVAKLAGIYLDQPEVQKVIVISPLVDDWRPHPALLDTLYGVFEQSSWLKTTTLSSAARSFPTAEKKITAKPVKREKSLEEQDYLEVLERARQDWMFFSGLVSKENPISQKLRRDLLIAEASDWPVDKDHTGWKLVENITRTITKELGKVQVSSVQKITFTNNAGKVRVAFFNGTAYIIKAQINLSGENLSFPGSQNIDVELRPKENIFDLKVKVTKPGEYPLRIALRRGGRVISETTIMIKSTYFDRFFCAFSLLVVLTVILLSMWQLKQRQHRE